MNLILSVAGLALLLSLEGDSPKHGEAGVWVRGRLLRGFLLGLSGYALALAAVFAERRCPGAFRVAGVLMMPLCFVLERKKLFSPAGTVAAVAFAFLLLADSTGRAWPPAATAGMLASGAVGGQVLLEAGKARLRTAPVPRFLKEVPAAFFLGGMLCLLFSWILR